MFTFHDETQPARIQQFVLNLKNLKIPPRIAPDLSFKMGYPVFNFYAPSAYWITGLLNFSGVDIVNSLKISFLLALILTFVFAFLFISLYLDFHSSLMGAVLYVTSLYFAVDIFVRGNLAETWFLALMPLTFYLLNKNSQRRSSPVFFLTTIVLSLTLTTHNLLSLLFLPLGLIYIFFHSNKRFNFLALFLALALSAYFFIPFAFENSFTHATQIAKITNYKNHFLCPNQLWQSNWGYGGSTVGCQDDGMSFKIGKPQLIFFFLGLLTFLATLNKNRKQKNSKIMLFFLIVSASSLYLTTYSSKVIWQLLEPMASLIQFPWRFISFSLLGISFFGGYFFSEIPSLFKKVVIPVIITATIIVNGKYFYKAPLLKQDFENKYLSADYISEQVAFKVPEYLSSTADYSYWQRLDKNSKDFQKLNFNYRLPIEAEGARIITNDPFIKKVIIDKPQEIKINIHYSPFWQIYIDEKSFVPSRFDLLGRPTILLNQPSTIKIVYKQTLIEQVSNLVSIIAFLFLLMLVLYKAVWKKLKIPNR